MPGKRWRWAVGLGLSGLGVGGGLFGGLLFLLTPAVVAMVFLGGIGSFLLHLLHGAPAIASPYSRPAEWLVDVDTLAQPYAIPNTLVLAVIEEASGGANFGDRYYCSNGRTAGEWCGQAFGPQRVGPHHDRSLPGATTLGIGQGLMGLDTRSGLIPAGQDPHAVAWNLKTGIRALSHYVGGDLEQSLEAFHLAVQAPPGWQEKTGMLGVPTYSQRVRDAVVRYSAGPHLGAWALAGWSAKTGAYTDPGHAPEWVFAVGTAPGPAAFALPWRPPTPSFRCDPVQVVQGKPVQHCHPVLVPHVLAGRTLALPEAVVGLTANGRRLAFGLSSADPRMPVWPGGTVWGLKVPLTGPGRLIGIVATWPGWTETIAWPETSGGPVGTVQAQPISQTLHRWWPDIAAASCKTGVPAALIAAKIQLESGGHQHNNPYGLAGAYGLMQLEPGTARGLPGWYPGARQNAARNVQLGAELLQALHALEGTWHLAIAAYYAGPGWLLAHGVPPGMAWSQAALRLDAIPDEFNPAGQQINFVPDSVETEEVLAEEQRALQAMARLPLAVACPG